ncbi:hypothetical protein [Neobacillus sp. YIM B06451]|uniref:hypothetical protein n=1 Tax=Neobacillus sp. YIM B06451 TaxID=3070994 RepID=UPI00292DB17B|nr:hypothetical protein [Neobacillus sp. YIM B06451]
MELFLLAKILGGIGLLLILINILFFLAGKDRGTKKLIYFIFFITLFVNITIWVIAAVLKTE